VGGIERGTSNGSQGGNLGPQSPTTPATPVPPMPPPTGSSNDLTFGGWFDLGFGFPGATTIPLLEYVIYAPAQSSPSLLVTDGLPGNDLYVIAGIQRQLTPFKGGMLVPSPDVLITGLTLDEQGELVVPLLDLELLPPLMLIYVQGWMPDAGNTQGFSATNAIGIVVP
jgi:hypothetical protein